MLLRYLRVFGQLIYMLLRLLITRILVFILQYLRELTLVLKLYYSQLLYLPYLLPL